MPKFVRTVRGTAYATGLKFAAILKVQAVLRETNPLARYVDFDRGTAFQKCIAGNYYTADEIEAALKKID